MRGVQCGAAVVSGFQALRVWLVRRFWGAGMLALEEGGRAGEARSLPFSLSKLG